MPNSRRRRWLTLLVQLAAVVLVLGFIGWYLKVQRGQLATALHELKGYRWHLEPTWLIVAGLLNLLGFLPAGLFWHRLLGVMGQEARIGESLRAYYVGQLGKYVPGKVWVVAIRTGLIRSHRVNTVVAAVSVFVETLTMMAVGGFIAAAGLATIFPGRPLLFLAGLGCMVLAGLPTVPPIFRFLLRRLGVARADPQAMTALERLGFGTLLAGWVAMAIGWVLTGASLWAVLRGIGLAGQDPRHILPSTRSWSRSRKWAASSRRFPPDWGWPT